MYRPLLLPWMGAVVRPKEMVTIRLIVSVTGSLMGR
jgi:hypothetical protein